MDFNHTDERRMLADTISRFMRNDYPLDDRIAAGASPLGFSADKWQAMAELGLVGALFPEENGGFGGGGFDIAVVFEELGKALTVEPFLDCALLPGSILIAAAPDAQAATIERVVSGEARLAVAIEETEARYDMEWMNASASQDGGGWRLQGQKAAARFADQAEALIVAARTGGKPGDRDGISLFLVPRDADGLTLHSYQSFEGGSVSEITLHDVSVEGGALIGPMGQGLPILEHARGLGIIALCAEALGIMQSVRDMTVEYLRTRKQFGVALGKFQALQHRMAEVLLKIEEARSAVINAAASLELEASEREMALSAAKYTIGQVGTQVAQESIQMHGGIGMTWEYDLGHFAKRLIMIDHELGDEDYHLERFMHLQAAARA